jgi:hypothetical protein
MPVQVAIQDPGRNELSLDEATWCSTPAPASSATEQSTLAGRIEPGSPAPVSVRRLYGALPRGRRILARYTRSAHAVSATVSIAIAVSAAQ